jgi:hypothetical protein
VRPRLSLDFDGALTILYESSEPPSAVKTSETGAILTGRDPQAFHEYQADMLGAVESAVVGDHIQRQVATFKAVARGVDAGALDECGGCDFSLLLKAPREGAGAHPRDLGQDVHPIRLTHMSNNMRMDARDRGVRLRGWHEIGAAGV